MATGALYAALAAGRRSFYTAPIKALVSEKFFALCAVFGADKVGMLTGDAAVNADAPIIACTAEVLANIALREGVDDVHLPRRRRGVRAGRGGLLRRRVGDGARARRRPAGGLTTFAYALLGANAMRAFSPRGCHQAVGGRPSVLRS